ncbi:AtpZ/AtpI family protein [Tumebacillus permanentifrigoris]|uniref:Putative F0F1-ATPase subunit (Ca2+/Mg2+ transporter) n=1 Tax=Tumebacillus permanentifrigoris TaxID=378543 RepID=A0A316DTI1_9BACL|nr:AtpZ/AtpI family protein [Tumebacillus permanentifrigoris]PWK10319.1 putative F0F1-ATPase subunit (Ca2+/Mg2+ transporter) [Tumebacillus permanentifrigoris]
MNQKKSDNREAMQAFGLVSMIGVDMASCTVGGVFLGKWLDSLWGTTPWMLLVGILLGLTAGILGVVKLLSKFGPEAGTKK